MSNPNIGQNISTPLMIPIGTSTINLATFPKNARGPKKVAEEVLHLNVTTVTAQGKSIKEDVVVSVARAKDALMSKLPTDVSDQIEALHPDDIKFILERLHEQPAEGIKISSDMLIDFINRVPTEGKNARKLLEPSKMVATQPKKGSLLAEAEKAGGPILAQQDSKFRPLSVSETLEEPPTVKVEDLIQFSPPAASSPTPADQPVEDLLQLTPTPPPASPAPPAPPAPPVAAPFSVYGKDFSEKWNKWKEEYVRYKSYLAELNPIIHFVKNSLPEDLQKFASHPINSSQPTKIPLPELPNSSDLYQPDMELLSEDIKNQYAILKESASKSPEDLAILESFKQFLGNFNTRRGLLGMSSLSD